MKNYTNLLWACFILATLSLLVGIIVKIAGFGVFGLGPISYLRFTGICLLYAISLSLVQISLSKKE
jgi:hypothetical protein